MINIGRTVKLTEVEEDSLEDKPAAVHDVVLPLDGIESDGIDILVENEGQ